MRILLDTNILVRLAQVDQPQHPIARDAVRRLIERADDLSIVPQNLYEFWVVATRPAAQNGLKVSVEQTARELATFKPIHPLAR